MCSVRARHPQPGHPPAGAGPPRSRRPERSGRPAAGARPAARRRAPPPSRPLRPPPLWGGEHPPRPRLLGAPRVVPSSPSPKRDPGPRPRPGSGSVRRFVVGTAGHIDHGKTALVKALTGVDTDRWEEEKRRGITIDLGFAPLPLADAVQASIVDVPGHEAFVKNMLAGATGIDVALLVVAADEGTMPQTEEHLAILELLGVQRGIPVIAKADLVDRDWLELVRAAVGGTRRGSSGAASRSRGPGGRRPACSRRRSGSCRGHRGRSPPAPACGCTTAPPSYSPARCRLGRSPPGSGALFA